ncbi:alpha/beta hydrolase [Nonomuraea sp. NN258]|uniref:alpha/beta hydrolase n=1 Tax=Nonomuraea antri TaxID=2730852 RepID=UPI001568F810|nr:alpha/beta hydrolase [Nonomuraea antri]NRQ32445.1 alpha/beta hydrolase [Nonomuraea antri]
MSDKVSAQDAGLLFRVLFLLVIAGAVGLSATLRFPEILLDPRSFAATLVTDNTIGVILSLAVLLASGAVLVVLSRRIGTHLIRSLGTAAGACWGTSAVLGLLLIPLWANEVAAGVPVLSWIAFAAGAIIAPLLLAGWTMAVVKQDGRGRVIGVLGAAGLLLTAARSALWALNAMLPTERGFHLTSAILTVAALLMFPLWPAWLARMGTTPRLLSALLAPILLVGYATATIGLAPAPRGNGAPAVPSAIGSALYLVAMAVPALLPLPTNEVELRADRQRDLDTRPELPAGATMERIDAGGVPSERICAGHAGSERMILYLPGGGFIEIAGNGPRRFAAAISRQTGACVLLAHYRLAPEHPYPAAMQDGVRAYRWLRSQGIAASRLAIVGDSAGGNLALTSALSLRQSGDTLPAALVSLSGVTDFTLRGETFRTLSDRDPILTPGTRKLTVDSYTRNGTIDLRDPLLSPLYADLSALPPTLLLAGSQEVLLSDVTRLGDRLRAAGVPGQTQVWPGMMHAWPLVADEAPESRMAIAQIADFLSWSWATLR